MSKSISDIKNELNNLDITNYPDFAKEYAMDQRSGVQKIVQKANKDFEKYQLEIKRTYELQFFERK